MFVDYGLRSINLDNIVEYDVWGDEIRFFPTDSDSITTYSFDYVKDAESAKRMISRHLSRGRGTCNLDLLAEYDKKGWIVFVTEFIRRTINRIAGRLGL